MSYELAIEWAIHHIPPQDYNSFNEWYRTVSNKMNTPNLMANPEFNRLLEKAWIDATGTDSEDNPVVIERTPSREREIKMQVDPRIYVAPSKELSKSPEAVVIPKTGRAPEIPRPILVFPKEQMSEIDKIKKFFGRLNPFKRNQK